MEKRFAFFLSFIFLLLAACNRPNTESRDTNLSIPTEDEGRPVEEELLNETNVDDDALGFMKDAAHGGTMEVELGILAQEKGRSQRVKNFGEMMVKDHKAAYEALAKLGAEKNVLIKYAMKPEQQKQVEELKQLSGAEFDKRYIDMMVKNHTKDISAFEAAADNRDKQVNRFATETLPTLRMHLDSAKAIQASLNRN
ncbi:MAG TPA: DUF4142 domain-containing protein [Sphingobacteriaceae bacterium]